MSPSATRRMYRRITAGCTGCYLTSRSLRQAVVRDVSLNGFRVEARTTLRRNAIVMLRLWLPGQDESIDIDQAVVKWSNRREFGVQIVSLSNQADHRVARYVEWAILQEATRMDARRSA